MTEPQARLHCQATNGVGQRSIGGGTVFSVLPVKHSISGEGRQRGPEILDVREATLPGHYLRS